VEHHVTISRGKPTINALIITSFFAAALLYTAFWSLIIPPWQIPDEGAHYEYVRLLTELGRVPAKGDENHALHEQMLRSMWENHHWEYLGYKRPEQPPKHFLAGGWTSRGDIPDTAVIGDAYIYAFSNLSNPQVVYYAMLAPVQRAVLRLPLADQLRALRNASHVIFALAIVFIVLTAMEFFGDNLALVIGTALIALLQPMFVYIGSGLNNDVGVTLMVALLAWQLAAGWRRGYSWPRILLVALTAVLAVCTKRTAVFVLIWVPAVIGTWWLKRIEPRKAKRLLIAAAAGCGALLAAGVLSYFIPAPTPSNWSTSTPWVPSWTSAEAHGGARAFMLNSQPNGDVRAVEATVKRPLGLNDGRQVVFSAWMKGVPGATGKLVLADTALEHSETMFSGTGQWQLVSVTLPLAQETFALALRLAGTSRAPVYADDLRLFIQAEQPVDLPVPNPSAEVATPVLGQVILDVGDALGVHDQARGLVQDSRASLAALPVQLPAAISFVEQSYWGKFGIFALAATPAIGLGSVTLLAILVGIAMGNVVNQMVCRRPGDPPWLLAALWGGGLILLIAQTLGPLLSYAASGLWLPQGRYLFGGMAIIAPLLAYGWVGWLPRRWQWLGVTMVSVVLTGLSVLLFNDVAQYFGRFARPL